MNHWTPHDGCDPYLVWAEVSGWVLTDRVTRGRAADGSLQLDLLLQCTRAFALGLSGLARVRLLEVVELTDGAEARGEATIICTVSAPLSLVRTWLHQWPSGLRRLELSTQRAAPGAAEPRGRLSARRLPQVPGSAARSSIRSRQVIVVIDDGLAFLHHRFQRPGRRTRVKLFWDQNDSPAGVPWRTVADMGYGRELDEVAINRLLARRGPQADESRIYRELGYDRVRHDLAHGTHVADLAAGADPRDAGDEPDIIMVQLPSPTVLDTSGGGTAKHVLDALVYVLRRVPRDAQVTVNLSFGAAAGPHDGSTMLEQAMAAIIRRERRGLADGGKRRNFAIVLPAGNSRDAAGHAQWTVAGHGSVSGRWHVRHDDPTESFCEIWYPTDQAHAITVSLDGPGGERIGPVRVDEAFAWGQPAAATCAVIHRRTGASGQHKSVCLVALAPTRDAAARATPGFWTITVSNESDQACVLDAWIQRDDPSLYTPFAARQSRFVASRPSGQADRQDIGADPVKRMGTGNSFAHGREVFVVGALEVSTGRASAYSAWPMPGRRDWPHAWFPADMSPMLPGIAAAGTHGSIRRRMNGTSVAAPQASRVLAALFRAMGGQIATRRMALQALRRPARQGPTSAPAAP